MNQALQYEHLDPDQINAFAEGVLPEHERLLAMAHLAECPQCRDVVFLAQEALAAESPAASVPAAPERATFWKRWFGPLPLAGAAALACGTVAFVMWRTPSPTSENQIAAVIPKQPPIPAPPPEAQKKPTEQQSARASKIAPPPKPMGGMTNIPIIAAPSIATSDEAVSGATARSTETANGILAKDRASSTAGNGPVNGVAMKPMGGTQAAIAPPIGVAPTVAAIPPQARPAPPVAAPLAEQAKAATIDAQTVNQLPVEARRVTPLPTVSMGAALDSAPAGPTLRSAPRSGTGSRITGTVTDQAGATIAGVHVALRLGEKTLPQSGTTDRLGQFSIADLTPGKYVVEFTAPSFQTLRQTVDVQPQTVAQLDSKLIVGTVSESVVVQGSFAKLPKEDPASLCEDPLPGTSLRSQCQISGGKALAVDQNGALFLHKGRGQWKAIPTPWTGSIRNLGMRGKQFEITTADGVTWLSEDGRHWHSQSH